MSRTWINALALVGGAIGGTLGWAVTQVACRPGSCAVSAALVALVSGVVAAAGVGLVMILVSRSLDEWRASAAAGVEPPDPGCESSHD